MTGTVFIGALAQCPTGIAITPDGAYAYITGAIGSRAVIVDTERNEVISILNVGPNPRGVAIHPDGSRAYIVNAGGSLTVVDTQTRTVLGTITLGGSPEGIAIIPDGHIYVSDRASHVWVVDAATNLVVATIPVGSFPWGLASTRDGSRVYVANYFSNSVSIINTSSNTVVGSVSVATPYGIAISP